jgi:hypothetical protein
MNLPVKPSSEKLKHKGTINPGQYRHSTRSRVGVPIHRQSRVQRGLYLRVKWQQWRQSMDVIGMIQGQTLMGS